MVVYVEIEGCRIDGTGALIGGSLGTIYLHPLDSAGISLGGCGGVKENTGCETWGSGVGRGRYKQRK